MADFCVDITQQVEFDEKVVCGLWQCEALRASQKEHRHHSQDNKIMARILNFDFAAKIKVNYLSNVPGPTKRRGFMLANLMT